MTDSHREHRVVRGLMYGLSLNLDLFNMKDTKSVEVLNSISKFT